MIFTHFLYFKAQRTRGDGMPLERYAATNGCTLSTSPRCVPISRSRSLSILVMIEIGGLFGFCVF